MNKMSIIDHRNQRQIGKFNQQLVLGLPQYKITINGRFYATMKMKFALLMEWECSVLSESVPLWKRLMVLEF